MTEPSTYSKALYLANRRHDIIAIDLHDPLELKVGNVGLIVMEDAETGEIIWVDTRDPRWRSAFATDVEQATGAKLDTLRQAGVDRIAVNTEQDYVDALTRFFHTRGRRQQLHH